MDDAVSDNASGAAGSAPASVLRGVADAIGAELVDQELRGDCDLSPEESNLLLARAALRGLREPPERILDCGAVATISGNRGRSRATWHAMIDAVLAQRDHKERRADGETGPGRNQK